GIDALEQPQHLLAIPAPELLRLDDVGSRHHGAGDETIADGGLEVARAGAQAVEAHGGALAGGDDEGGGAGASGLWDLDLAGGTESLGDPLHGGECLGRGAAPEIAAGNRDAQA